MSNLHQSGGRDTIRPSDKVANFYLLIGSVRGAECQEELVAGTLSCVLVLKSIMRQTSIHSSAGSDNDSKGCRITTLDDADT